VILGFRRDVKNICVWDITQRIVAIPYKVSAQPIRAVFKGQESQFCVWGILIKNNVTLNAPSLHMGHNSDMLGC